MEKKALIEARTIILLGIILIGVIFIAIGIKGLENSDALVVGEAVSAMQESIENPALIEEKADIDSSIIETSATAGKENGKTQNNYLASGRSSATPKATTAQGKKVIENQKGSIEFSAPVDVPDLDIEKYVSIRDNFISIDSENLPELNQPATLTLRGIYYDYSPIIMRDGQICYDCQIKSYSNGELVFTVPHFSNYTTMQCTGLSSDLYLNSGAWKCDINSGANSASIIINSSNVELDCAGSSITGGNSIVGIKTTGPPESEMNYWAQQTSNFSNLSPILNDIDGFLGSVTFLSNVTIKNCILNNIGYGANITALKDSLITGNKFDNATTMFAVENVAIEGNEFSNSDTALMLVGINSAVRNNIASNNKNGIIVAGFGNEVSGNNASNNEKGITSVFGIGTRIAGNIVTGNSGTGISLIEAENNTVTGNLVENNNIGISMGGLFTQGPSSGNVIENNTILGNREAGIETGDSTLINLFRMIAGKKLASYFITGNSIISNKLDNPAKDILIKGAGFTGNDIKGNELSGGGLDISCSIENDIDFTNKYLNSAKSTCPSVFIDDGLAMTGDAGMGGGPIISQLMLVGNNPTDYDFKIAPLFLGTHSGPNTSCEGIKCERRWLRNGTLDFNLTNGTDIIGTMQLDGVFLATTFPDQATFNGISLMWGNATIVSQSPDFGFGGNYIMMLEAWNNNNGALAIINETGVKLNITQFAVNMSRILTNNEIIIVSAPKVGLSSLSDNVSYEVNVSGFGALDYFDGYETLKYSLSGYPDIKNRTLFIGNMDILQGLNITSLSGFGKGWFNATEGKYHKVFYGYVENEYSAECIWDSDCDDSNDATIDRCVDDVVGKICANQIPLIYGTAVDAITGAPLEGEQVSIYNAQENENPFVNCLNYDENGTEIGNCSLQPKDIPDALTDENGHYYVIGPPGVYHLVVNGSREDTLNKYVGHEVDHIYLPKNGTIKVVVEPDRIEAGFHSSAYVKDDGVVTKVFEDSHVTQTPVYVNVSQTGNLEFFISVRATNPYNFNYNLSTIDSNNHVSCYNRTYKLNDINSSNQVIIDQLDGDTWRLWFEDLPPGHHWRENNKPKEPDYDDVVFLIDYFPNNASYNATNFTNETNYDCDKDTIPNYLDSDDDWCDYGDIKTEIVNESEGELYTAGQIIYSGRGKYKNQYLEGEELQFMIFGTNNMSTDQKVTYVIEDHSHGQLRNNVTGEIIYYGNIDLDNESLTIYNDGGIWEKIFNFNIPFDISEKIDFNKNGNYNDYYELNSSGPYPEAAVGYDLNHDGDMEDNYSISAVPTEYFDSDGRYDIHIWHNDSKEHKLGDFYVIADKDPVLNAGPDQSIYTNETALIGFSAYDPIAYGDNTVHILIEGYGPAVENNITITTKVLQINETDTSQVYDGNNSVGGQFMNTTSGEYYINFTESGYYNITFTATNVRGRSTNKTVSIAVYITEDEADQIALPLYVMWGINDWDILYDYNWSTIGTIPHPVTTEWDMVDIITTQIGHEYMTKWDSGDYYGLNQSEVNWLNNQINNQDGPSWVKPIPPSTTIEFNQTLNNFLYTVACVYYGSCI